MTDTILILTEDTLNAADVQHILSLHEGEELLFRVLVPADDGRTPIESIIDFLSSGELKEAWDEIIGREPSPTQEKDTAEKQLTESIARLRAAGAGAEGEVLDGDPMREVVKEVLSGGIREIVVVTYPHAVEDTFHTDWASTLRAKLDVPVLHLYSGTSELG